MKKTIGIGIILTAACLGGSGRMAFGQGGGAATVGGQLGTVESGSLVTAPNNLEQKANEQAQANGTPAANTAIPGVNTAAPGGQATVPGGATGAGTTTAIPGSVTTPAGTAGRGANTAAPNGYQGPANARDVPPQPANTYPNVGNAMNRPGQVNNGAVGNAMNPTGNLNQTGIGAGNAMNQPGMARGTPMNNAAAGNAGQTYTPGLANPGEWNYRSNPNASYANQANQGIYPGTSTAATPGYTGRLMPGMGGYNSVNPMGTTMAPGYYYAGSAGLPYATYNTPGNPAGTAMPYAYGATTAYPTTYMNRGYGGAPAQGYSMPRRGLFGRRNRVVYPASPYGSNNNYGSYPSGYTTYGAPGTYGNTTYTTPGSYTNGAYPY